MSKVCQAYQSYFAKIAVLKFCLIRVSKIYEIYTKHIRNIYEVYTNIYKIYTKYQAAARRRLPGQAPRRGPGPARAPRGLAGQPPPGRRLVFCIYLVYICIYLHIFLTYFVYISYIFKTLIKQNFNTAIFATLMVENN